MWEAQLVKADIRVSATLIKWLDNVLRLDDIQIIMELDWCLYSNLQKLMILLVNVFSLRTEKIGNLVAASAVTCLKLSNKKEVKILDQIKRFHLGDSLKQIPIVYPLKHPLNIQSLQ